MDAYRQRGQRLEQIVQEASDAWDKAYHDEEQMSFIYAMNGYVDDDTEGSKSSGQSGQSVQAMANGKRPLALASHPPDDPLPFRFHLQPRYYMTLPDAIVDVIGA